MNYNSDHDIDEREEITFSDGGNQEIENVEESKMTISTPKLDSETEDLPGNEEKINKDLIKEVEGNTKENKTKSPGSYFKSKGMHKISYESEDKQTKELSPRVFEILDKEGEEVVEKLEEKGTIKKYPPIQHSPNSIKPRKIIYSANYNDSNIDIDEREIQPKSPEIELVNDSAYIPLHQKESPFRDKENIELNHRQPPQNESQIPPESHPYPHQTPPQIPQSQNFSPPNYKSFLKNPQNPSLPHPLNTSLPDPITFNTNLPPQNPHYNPSQELPYTSEAPHPYYNQYHPPPFSHQYQIPYQHPQFCQYPQNSQIWNQTSYLPHQNSQFDQISKLVMMNNELQQVVYSLRQENEGLKRGDHRGWMESREEGDRESMDYNYKKLTEERREKEDALEKQREMFEELIKLRKINQYRKGLIDDLEQENDKMRIERKEIMERMYRIEKRERQFLEQIKELNETLNEQDKIIDLLKKKRDREEEVEREDDDLERDPYINLDIKKERMPYQVQNVYKPLNNFYVQDKEEEIEVKSSRTRKFQMTPEKKPKRYERARTPGSTIYNKNLRSSVGECLSWQDGSETPEKASKSVARYTKNSPSDPKKFSQSFAQKPPLNPLDPPYQRSRVHFLDNPAPQNPQISQSSKTQPSQKPRSASHQNRASTPIFADHQINPTSLAIPSDTYPQQTKIQMYNLEKDIARLTAEQAKKQEEFDRISEYSKSNWERRRKRQLETDVRVIQANLQFLNRKYRDLAGSNYTQRMRA
ncbi:unnamed protein product [Moneuplotes crassus]|uniref:Uncharacterized protein n=1 Tax=Euplotes crassus TaxID=5936 RepID=A0AAD1Y0P1_EUPCR|nr:unnamed protein product [Moneuplotes crassus]